MREQPLKDITLPYLGVYECKVARLGEEDLFSRLRFARIELDKGSFRFIGKEKDGKLHRERGKFSYDKESGALRFFSWQKSGDRAGIARLEKGEITLLYPCGDNTLYLLFSK